MELLDSVLANYSGTVETEFRAQGVVHEISFGLRDTPTLLERHVDALDHEVMGAMSDTTIKKVETASSPRGEMGQKYLVAGKRVSMRLWVLEPGGEVKHATSRDYETVGYVISGRATLDLEGQTLSLQAGDSWLVPAGATHKYKILERFTAVEATSPPAEVHGRDRPE
jgi:quercetin dioxygenase-like cupin family protein